MGHVGKPNLQRNTVYICSTEIRDVNTHYYSAWGITDLLAQIAPLDVSQYKTITIEIQHTHDQDLNFKLLNYHNLIYNANYVCADLTIPQAPALGQQHSSISFDVKNSGIQNILCYAKYSVAPTTGWLTLILVGVPK